MPLLSRNKQVVFGVEAFPGTALTLSSSNNVIRAINPQINLDLGKIDDDAASPSIGVQPIRAGIRRGSISFEVELSGNKAGGFGTGTPPPWENLVLACGYRRALNLKKLTITGFDTGTVFKAGLFFTADLTGGTNHRVFRTLYDASGETTLWYEEDPSTPIGASDTQLTLSDPGGDYDGNIVDITSQTGSAVGVGYAPVSRHRSIVSITGLGGAWDAGDTIEGGTSGTVGRVAGYTAASSTKLRYELLYGFGFVNGETLTRTSGGGGTATTATDSLGTAGMSLTMGVNDDGVFKTLYGTRGQFVLQNTSGQASRLQFTFEGVYNSVLDQVPFSVTPEAGAVPPRFVSGTLWAGEDAVFVPVIDQIAVTSGSGLTPQEDATAVEGIRQVLIGQRKITFAMAPEESPEEVFALYAKAAAATEFPLRAAWGTAGSANAFSFQMDRVQIRSATPGDRGGKLVSTLAGEAFEYVKDDSWAILVE